MKYTAKWHQQVFNVAVNTSPRSLLEKKFKLGQTKGKLTTVTDGQHKQDTFPHTFLMLIPIGYCQWYCQTHAPYFVFAFDFTAH